VKGLKLSRLTQLVKIAFPLGLGLITSLALAASSDSPIKRQIVTEQQLIPLLKGNIWILGHQFPGRDFQRAVLKGLRSNILHVRVITGQESLNYFAPIKRAGGEVRIFTGKLSGQVAVVGNNLIVVQEGKYQVISGPNVASSVLATFDNAWRYAQ
jgi:hypothetical protein